MVLSMHVRAMTDTFQTYFMELLLLLTPLITPKLSYQKLSFELRRPFSSDRIQYTQIPTKVSISSPKGLFWLLLVFTGV
jgi:hypothetical protein